MLTGRFFSDGHCKNQHLAISAFLTSSLPEKGYVLKLIGRIGSEKYYKRCKSLAGSSNAVDFLIDISDEKRDCVLSKSSYVLSASGLEEVKNSNIEHFGIAFGEAILAGCFPIAYGVGGPAEIVRQIGKGYLFYDEKELVEMFNLLSEREELLDEADLFSFERSFGSKAFFSNVSDVLDNIEF